MGESQVQYFDEIPQGWKQIVGAMTAPVGYEWISNGKSRFSADYRKALVKEKPNREISFSRKFTIAEPTEQEESAGRQAQMAGIQFSNEPGISEKLNRLAREEMKLRLLKDIAADITICKLEGWEYKEYLRELQHVIGRFLNGGELPH